MSTATIPHRFIDPIRALPSLSDDDAPRPEFLLWSDTVARLSCYYAPFEYVNEGARIIIVGITPGSTQMNRALNAANRALEAGTPIESAIRRVKREGSFSGSMRQNLVATMNRLGYSAKLGLSCSSELWADGNHLVQFSSLLKFPVFINGKDYNGSPHILRQGRLKEMVLSHFASDMQRLAPDALLVPLGDVVMDAIMSLKQLRLIPQELMFFEGRPVALPHPSGANAESIALLLEKRYPSKTQYAEEMYREYLLREGWKKKGG